MRHRQRHDALRRTAVVCLPVVLDPSRVRGVGVRMARADVVMLARDHAAKP